MEHLETLKDWNISDWQKYLREVGLQIVEAGDYNKKKWYFITNARYERNPIKSQAGWLYSGFRFILDDAWKL